MAEPIFYCHGLPGSAFELDTIVACNTLKLTPLSPMDTKEFDIKNGEDKAHIIGFSLGAMSAIHIAGERPERVARLSLIAPAVPLELGDFLPVMAGRPVFEMAKRGINVFRIFTATQSIGVRLSPEITISAMFKDSPEADRALLLNPAFKADLIHGLRQCLIENRGNYRAVIRRYVQPWADELSRVTCPVTIHHGTSDNWVPFSAGQALSAALETCADVIPYETLGHYSTLHAALPNILERHAPSIVRPKPLP